MNEQSQKKNNSQYDAGVILLAAGKAERFGSDKRLARVNGQTLLQTTLQCYQALPCDLILVLNAEPSSRLLDIVPPEVKILRANSKNHWGMGDSIALGADYAIQSNWRCCLIALADMPYVQSATLLNVLATLSRHDTVVPCYNGQWGHPVGFARQHFVSLASLTGDRGAKSVLQAAKPFVLEVDDPGVVRDVDVPADLQ